MIDDIIDEYDSPEKRILTRKQEELRTTWRRIGIVSTVLVALSVAIYFPFFYNQEQVIVKGVVYDVAYTNRGTHVYSEIYFRFAYKGTPYRCMEQRSIHDQFYKGNLIQVLVDKENPDKSKIRPSSGWW